MIPNLSELVRDMLLYLCCYGDEGRGGLTGERKQVRQMASDLHVINADTPHSCSQMKFIAEKTFKVKSNTRNTLDS